MFSKKGSEVNIFRVLGYQIKNVRRNYLLTSKISDKTDPKFYLVQLLGALEHSFPQITKFFANTR